MFAWVAVIIIYYFSFSLLFDTPYEHKIRQSTKTLNQEYERLSERYDSLELVLENITAREKGVFRTLFETDPYDLDVEQSEERVALYEKNVSKSKRQLTTDLTQRINELSRKTDELENSWKRIKE